MNQVILSHKIHCQIVRYHFMIEHKKKIFLSLVDFPGIIQSVNAPTSSSVPTFFRDSVCCLRDGVKAELILNRSFNSP